MTITVVEIIKDQEIRILGDRFQNLGIFNIDKHNPIDTYIRVESYLGFIKSLNKLSRTRVIRKILPSLPSRYDNRDDIDRTTQTVNKLNKGI